MKNSSLTSSQPLGRLTRQSEFLTKTSKTRGTTGSTFGSTKPVDDVVLGSGTTFTGASYNSNSSASISSNGVQAQTSNSVFAGSQTTLHQQHHNIDITTQIAAGGGGSYDGSLSASSDGFAASGQLDGFAGTQMQMTLLDNANNGQVTVAAEHGVSGNAGGTLQASGDGVVANANLGFHTGSSASVEGTVNFENESGDSFQLTGGGSVGPAVSFTADAGIDTTGDETTIHAHVGGNVLMGASLGTELTISDQTVDMLQQIAGAGAFGSSGTSAAKTLSYFQENQPKSGGFDYRI